MPQIEAKREENIISGIWKFSDRIPLVEIAVVAGELLETEPNAYRHMQIRKCSKDQFGICFVYDLGESAHNSAAYHRFFDKHTDSLKRQFGNAFTGWDVTNEVWTLK